MILDNYSAFIILSPDAVVTGLYKKALDSICNLGISIIKSKWVKITPEQVNLIYSENYKNQSFKSDLVESLFNLDYSLVCIVKSTIHSDLVGFLKDFKGVSNPLFCQENKLRKILGAENKILNFIHTSDSLVEAMKESSIFFSGSEKEQSYITYVPQGIQSISGVSIWDTKMRLRRNLVQLYNIYDEVQEHYFSLINQITKEQKREFGFNEIINLEEKQNSLLKIICKQDSVNLIFKELGELHYHINSEIIKNLESIGVGISDWDRLIINCHKSHLDDTNKHP